MCLFSGFPAFCFPFFGVQGKAEWKDVFWSALVFLQSVDSQIFERSSCKSLAFAACYLSFCPVIS